MKKVEAIIAPSELDAVRDSLVAHGVEGLSISEAGSYGREPYRVGRYRGTPYTVDLHPKIKLEIVVCDEDTLPTAYAIADAARTGRVDDGTLMIVPIEDAVRVRTGEHGPAAIHDHIQPPVETRMAALG
jgi:nitrogen regulatory protein P-II 1